MHVCCLFYFLLHGIFSKEKNKVRYLAGFIVFLSGFFEIKSIFLVGSNYINHGDNYGCLIDFLSQISKLSYFNLLDLADFVMHRTSFPFRFCVNTVAHLRLRYVQRFELHHKLTVQADWSYRLTQAVSVLTPKHLSNCTYNIHMIKNKFSCVLYADSQFLCSLQVSSCQLWVSAKPAAYLLIDCYSTWHSRSLALLQLWTALTQHWVCSTLLF